MCVCVCFVCMYLAIIHYYSNVYDSSSSSRVSRVNALIFWYFLPYSRHILIVFPHPPQPSIFTTFILDLFSSISPSLHYYLLWLSPHFSISVSLGRDWVTRAIIVCELYLPNCVFSAFDSLLLLCIINCWFKGCVNVCLHYTKYIYNLIFFATSDRIWHAIYTEKDTQVFRFPASWWNILLC